MGRHPIKDRTELHNKLLADLGDAVIEHTPEASRPLGIKLCKPFNLDIEVHLFPLNYTKTRNYCEYKFCISLHGQRAGDKGSLPCILGSPILMAYSKDYDVYVLFDAYKHFEFTAFTNIQCPHDLLLEAFSKNIANTTKKNGEVIVGVKSDYIIEGLRKRLMP